MAEELKVVGKGITRIDAAEKVTGKAKFVADIYPCGMLYGVVLRSPYAHARIKKIDTSRAEKLEWVRARCLPIKTYHQPCSVNRG